MNSVNIIGRMTADPEIRSTQNGAFVCSFSLAVKRPHKKDVTDFFNCTVWRQGAEYLSKYAHKGDIVAATGYLTVREWQDKNGDNRKAVEIVCDSVEIIGGKKQNGSSAPDVSYTAPAEKEDFPFDDDNSDLPW